MAEMGLGYGSEFQLLRFLGHHRTELENYIRTNTKFKSNFEWLDFPYNKSRLSLDGEYIGISFLKRENPKLVAEWNNYWPQSGTSQNWDAIFKHDDEYVLVEAKAHLKEIQQNCTAKEEGREKIISALNSTKEFYGVNTNNSWLKNYYQLANRLAFIKFLYDNKVKASLLNIYFINGYEKRNTIKEVIEKKSVLSQEEWEINLQIQYDYLGIKNSKAMNYINSIFVDCIK